MACPNMKPEIENMDKVTLGFCLSDLRLELADAILASPGRDLRQETSQSVLHIWMQPPNPGLHLNTSFDTEHCILNPQPKPAE